MTLPPRPARTGRSATSSDPTTAYANAVLAGTIVAGPHVRAACRRHVADLAEGSGRGLRFDRAAADRALSFFPDVLRLNAGQFEGRQFGLEPSQAFIVGSLFGWKRADGHRRFRRAYVEQGKGNGKSPLAAGIGLYMLLADGEARAEVYAAGSKKDQAFVLFRDAVAMVDQSPALADRLVKSGGNPVWNLGDAKTGSFFRPISNDDGQSGPRPHCALCDEVHEHRDRRTIEMLERGFKWRRQPLLLMTTNSGTDRNSVCFEEHEHAVKVAAGEVADDETFAYVCALDEGDDWLEDPACWVKANPLLGVTVTPGYLAGNARQAKAMPGKLNGIARLHFCQWTDAETAWISRQALEAVLSDFDPAEFAGETLSLGADLSAAQDLTALAFCARAGSDEQGRPTFAAWVEAWTPGDTLQERSLRDRAPYDVWRDEGFLNAPPGKVIRLDHVAARIAGATSEYHVQALAYDRYGFRKLEDELDALGVTVTIAEHPQGGRRRAAESGLWMPGSLTELEMLILDRRIRIRRSPVIYSACASAALESDPFGNRWFSKRRATQRIDALVALAMAVGAASRKEAPTVDLNDYLAHMVVA